MTATGPGPGVSPVRRITSALRRAEHSGMTSGTTGPAARGRRLLDGVVARGRRAGGLAGSQLAGWRDGTSGAWRERRAQRGALPNPMATAALVLALLSVLTGFLLGIPAVVCGVVGAFRPRHRRRAVTGIVLGVVTTLVSVVLLWGVATAGPTVYRGYRLTRTVLELTGMLQG